MPRYEEAVKLWQSWNIQTEADLSLRLDSFRILFAYHSGKIENDEINYHDTPVARRILRRSVSAHLDVHLAVVCGDKLATGKI